MGTDTLINRLNGQIIDQDAINLINRVLQGDFVGRNSSGAPTPGQNLGTAPIPWGIGRFDSLIVDGLPIEPALITATPNRIISGAVRATSDFPDYLRPAGSGGGAAFTLLATTTLLSFDVNGTIAQFTVDTVKGSLAVAPSANNTCLINDVGLTGQDTSKNLGENDTVIPVDNMGTELTGKIGQFVALLNQATGEIMYCRIESATQLVSAKRGFFFNSSGVPIQRAVLNNNDTLQVLSLGFIFIDKNGTTIDVSFRNPVIDGNQPAAPQTGDYWLDTSVDVWKRFSGATFDQIDRTFAGYVVIDTVDAIGTRPEYFSKSYSDENTLEVDLITVDLIRSHQAEFLISIDGSLVLFDFSFFDWVAATDFETGVIRTINRDYWLYISELGKPFISDKKPYDNLGFLKGWYHPYESWRAVAQVFNNAANQFELVNPSDETLLFIEGDKFFPGIPSIANGTDAVNDIDFDPRTVTLDDNLTKITITETLTKRLDSLFTEGNNGGMRDTGAIADGTWHIFLIYDPVLRRKDYLASLNLTAPTLPAGFTEKQRIWSILRIAGVIVLFTQTDNFCQYTTRFLDVDGDALSTTGIAVGITTPAGIETRALNNIQLQTTSVRFMLITSPSETNSAAASNFSTLASGGGTRRIVQTYVKTNTNAEIRHRTDASGIPTEFFIFTLGYIDDLLKKSN